MLIALANVCFCFYLVAELVTQFRQHHVNVLPEITKPFEGRTRRFVIGDSIEGWSDAIKVLIKSYLGSKRSSKIKFDYSDIRPKGARLVTSGGKAPGPQPLKECLVKIKGILDAKEDGTNLQRLKYMILYVILQMLFWLVVSDVLLLISLFSAYDEEMISCKSGNWWEKNPQRGRSNNSAVLMRHKITKEFFLDLWKRIELSGAGEPGIYFNHDKDWGTNPCCEIALRPYQFCNLCEVNVSDVTSQEDLNDRVKAACFHRNASSRLYGIPLSKRNMARDNRKRRTYRCVNDRNRECRCAPNGYEGQLQV